MSLVISVLKECAHPVLRVHMEVSTARFELCPNNLKQRTNVTVFICRQISTAADCVPLATFVP